MMDQKTKKIVLRETSRFAIYFILVFLFSIYSSTSRTMVEGEVVTKFFGDLFGLHLFSWILIYAIIRVAVWFVKALFSK